MVLGVKYISAITAAIAHPSHIEFLVLSFHRHLCSLIIFCIFRSMKTPTLGTLPAKNRIRMQASAIQV